MSSKNFPSHRFLDYLLPNKIIKIQKLSKKGSEPFEV